jgi:predicted dehydrogenase
MRLKNRRKFLQDSIGLGATAGFTLLNSQAIRAQTTISSQNKILGANDRIRIGVIGCGGMGWGNIRDFIRFKEVEVASVCDVDDDNSALMLKRIESESGQRAINAGRDFRKVLDQKDIDAVVISTPDHWHALMAVMACQAGKDIYVEKPLALTIGEGRIIVDAARKYNRVVQVGTQQRSAPHFQRAIEYVKSGKLGKIRLVRAWSYQDWMGNVPKVPDSEPPPNVDYDMWLGPAPKRPFNKNRFHFNFRWFWDYSGGLMTDWGAHMIDIANWGMGIKAPSSAMSVGGKYGYPDDAEETPDTQQVLWGFSDFSMIWEHATALGRGPEVRDHGVAFHGNNGVLVVDRNGWEVYPETETGKEGKVYRSIGHPRQRPDRAEMHLLHVDNFLQCMRNRNRPVSDVEIGHNSLIACHLGNIAYRLGRQVKWDVENERILDDKEAQGYVMKEYRAPWKLSM